MWCIVCFIYAYILVTVSFRDGEAHAKHMITMYLHLRGRYGNHRMASGFRHVDISHAHSSYTCHVQHVTNYVTAM